MTVAHQLFLAIATCLACTVPTLAQRVGNNNSDRLDTITIYRNWDDILAQQPAFSMTGHILYQNNELEYKIYTRNAQAQAIIDTQALAIEVGDSLWLINANYLVNNFETTYTGFTNFVPIFFNEKTAFVHYWEDYPDTYLSRSTQDENGEKIVYAVQLHYGESRFYIIDFVQSTIKKLNHNLLEQLLVPYHDLYSRYTGMKKNKKTEVIDFFFQKYLERLAQDVTVPPITEQIKAKE